MELQSMHLPGFINLYFFLVIVQQILIGYSVGGGGRVWIDIFVYPASS